MVAMMDAMMDAMMAVVDQCVVDAVRAKRIDNFNPKINLKRFKLFP